MGTRHRAHGTWCGIPGGHKHGIHEVASCQQLLVAAGRLSYGSNAVVPADTVTEPEVDHFGRLRVTAIRASNCPHCPGPGDENVGPLSLASIGLSTVAAEHADQPGGRPPRRWGLRTKGLLSWRAAIHPWAGTAVITLWRLITLSTAPTGRSVALVARSDLHLVLEPNHAAS